MAQLCVLLVTRLAGAAIDGSTLYDKVMAAMNSERTYQFKLTSVKDVAKNSVNVMTLTTNRLSNGTTRTRVDSSSGIRTEPLKDRSSYTLQNQAGSWAVFPALQLAVKSPEQTFPQLADSEFKSATRDSWASSEVETLDRNGTTVYVLKRKYSKKETAALDATIRSAADAALKANDLGSSDDIPPFLPVESQTYIDTKTFVFLGSLKVDENGKILAGRVFDQVREIPIPEEGFFDVPRSFEIHSPNTLAEYTEQISTATRTSIVQGRLKAKMDKQTENSK